ncbi:MAG TPA: DinB family protein [Pyrinomonadaceae bacterium]|nr:DinB family protein [Pyrinomonadaceae bacterium]
MIERYQRWFEYEQDSHAKTLASLSAVASELRSSEEFAKALYLMGHIIAGRRMWLFRLGFLDDNTELFPGVTDLEDLAAQLSEMEAHWSQYLNQLNNNELDRIFEYTSYEGGHFRNSVEDILTQLFGHSWYHRGQIAMLLRSIGAEPAVTDFVFWAREVVS